jgi:hypothetical protein
MSCEECHSKKGSLRARVGKTLCKDCNMLGKYITFTKTESKKRYLLTDEELGRLNEYVARSPYGMATYYLKSQVLELACIKHDSGPDEVEDKIIEFKRIKEEERNKRRQIKQNKRKEKLINELNKVGLSLRGDSVLCQDYIYGNDSEDLEWIVSRMCQMKYLFEYCNMNECKNEAYEEYRNIRAMGLYPDFKVFERAEDIALEKYSNGKYPKVFPWLKNLNI